VSFAREGLIFIGILMILALWVAYFFRDPERSGDRGGGLVIAPADGKVVMITEVDEPAFLHGKALRISIFMNVFNVHVNRYPVSGTVRFVHYNPGKFLNAATDKSSLENEQMSVGIEQSSPGSGTLRVLVRQIAGLVARRIVTYSREGDVVEQGERMGIIRFGSRVDVFLPTSATPAVQVGDITLAGSSVIAKLADDTGRAP
jgi:phosphatidylserine decarboxylase